MSATHDVIGLVVELDELRPMASHPEPWIRFMLGTCDLVASYLPDEGRRAIAAARRYWVDGEGSRADLQKSWDECWSNYQELSPEARETEKSAIAVRAAILVLFPNFNNDNGLDLLELFLGLLKRVRDISSEEVQILHELFAEVWRDLPGQK